MATGCIDYDYLVLLLYKFVHAVSRYLDGICIGVVTTCRTHGEPAHQHVALLHMAGAEDADQTN